MAKKQMELDGIDAQSALGKLLAQFLDKRDRIVELEGDQSALMVDILEKMKEDRVNEINYDGYVFYRTTQATKLKYRKRREVKIDEAPTED